MQKLAHFQRGRHLSRLALWLWLPPCMFFYVLSIQSASAQTNVSGSIVADETWTKANSPYILTGSVTVNQGITLTIEQGVELQFSRYDRDLILNGTLKAEGTAQDTIVFLGTDPTSRRNGGMIMTANEKELPVSFIFCAFT